MGFKPAKIEILFTFRMPSTASLGFFGANSGHFEKFQTICDEERTYNFERYKILLKFWAISLMSLQLRIEINLNYAFVAARRISRAKYWCGTIFTDRRWHW